MSRTGSAAEVLRKLVFIGLLAGGLVPLVRFGLPAPELEPTGILALGFALLTCFAVGELAVRVRLPAIAGYLVVGLALGPSMARLVSPWLDLGPLAGGVLDDGVVGQLHLLDTLALALIALTAGGGLEVVRLRRGLGAILGVLTGQVVTIGVAIVSMVWLVSGPIGAVALPELDGLGLGTILALGGAVASVGLATSPAATIGVITGSRASGPMTRTVLSTVVLKDGVVVFLFALSCVAAGAGTGVGGVGGVLVRVGGSLLVGGLVGAALGLWVHFARAEKLLALLGLVFAGSFVVGRLDLDPMLVFLAAGFVTANSTREGRALIRHLNRLSVPVYVVYFVLIGAGLHLESLQRFAGYAVALVVLRLVALWVGVGVGARLGQATVPTRRHGWLGFASQDGVALALSAALGQGLGPAGEVLAAILVAGVVLNTLVGPVLLQLGLRLAGEDREAASQAVEVRAPQPVGEPAAVEEGARGRQPLPRWTPPARVADPWGPPVQTHSEPLDEALAELEADLQGLVRDLLQGPLEAGRTNAHTYLRALRREFLRHHRRILVEAQGADATASLRSRLRADLLRLAERWRALVLDRAALLTLKAWSPDRLVAALDRIADSLPEELAAPYSEHTLRARSDESPWITIRRAVLRLRHRLHRIARSELPPRRVRLEQLGRYHLTGRAPLRLEAVAALLVTAEEQIIGRTRSLFEGISAGFDDCAQALERTGEVDEVVSRLWTVRREVDEEFALATEEIDLVFEAGAVRTARILGELLKAIKDEVTFLGSMDLPTHQRRPSQVHAERIRGLGLLTEGFAEARRTTSARYRVLALELELVGLEGRIGEVIEEHGSYLSRMVRGRSHTQMVRVDAALEAALTAFSSHLDTEEAGQALSAALRGEAGSLERVVVEASRGARQLQQQLGEESAMAPLLDALLAAARDLTERYSVPTGVSHRGEWRLPTAVVAAEVPFREVVTAYIESSVTRDLLELTHELGGRVHELVVYLEELGRVVAFNIELACAELDVLHAEPVSEETRELTRDMVVGALGRSQRRVQELVEQTRGWSDEVRQGIRAAVLTDLEHLRGQIVDGRASELRQRLLRDTIGGGRRARDAQRLSDVATRLRDQALLGVRSALGEERLGQLRAVVGLPAEVGGGAVGPGSFAAVPVSESLPVVYRRLFSDQALEAGDLLVGRQDELQRARRALSSGARLRTVAVVGPIGVGKGAFINVLARQLGVDRVRTICLDAPVPAAEVRRWFGRGSHEELTVVDGFAWLFSLRPGGLEALRCFEEGLVGSRDERMWVVECTESVWRFARRVAALGDAFAEVVQLEPLGAEQLAAALLSRHSMSGYQLRFDSRGEPGRLWRRLVGGGVDPEIRRRADWFAALHRSSAGIVRDALRLWLAAVREVDEERGMVHMGQVPRPPLAALRQLPDEVLLTLRQTTRQGWTTVDQHAIAFRLSPADAAAHLARLVHLGVLETRGDHHRIAEHLSSSVLQVLAERGWT